MSDDRRETGAPPDPTTHELKTWPDPFAAILDGRKRFEIRKNDRRFAVGDVLHLREWSPGIEAGYTEGYTGREMRVRVTYLVPPGKWGLPADLCVMGIAAPVAGSASFSEALRDLRQSADVASFVTLGARADFRDALARVESLHRDEVERAERAEAQRDHAVAHAVKLEESPLRFANIKLEAERDSWRSEAERVDRCADQWQEEAFRAGRALDRIRARLARILRVVQGTGVRLYWTEHNGGGSVWRWHKWPTDFARARGRVWSRALAAPPVKEDHDA